MSQSKYRNVKYIAFDGREFHSKKEGKRYEELMLMQGAGIIGNLSCQVKFCLVPTQRDAEGKLMEKMLQYVADFVYDKDGKTVVEDVKGYRGGSAYSIFKIKKKLMLWIHGLEIKET